jgi:hypothetical protein
VPIAKKLFPRYLELLEEQGIPALARTADTREGVNSFVERRPPIFEGR